ncbi:methyltransferase domain-containing protein [Henriciella aquimarina]|uniref:methyltransferase domain-containing protein n=1 Tax=Henriciella aquimarina TaxID=545261 RepID=UPI001301A96E|nr:methyltransferase domain-containing protein [Henriciella aquimarina]
MSRLPEARDLAMSLPWIEQDHLMREILEKLEKDSQWRLGGIRIRETFQKWVVLAEKHLDHPPRKVMDFGAGMYHPLANVARFRVLYGSDGVGVELDPRFLPKRAAKCLADTLFEAWLEGDAEARERVQAFDMKALKEGKWQDKPAQGIERFIDDVRELDEDGFDFVFSQSVMEHVDEFENVIAALSKRTTSGGVHAHVIDMRDHRSYYRPDATPWSFLCEDDPDGPFCNRLRASEIVEIFKRQGFKVITMTPQEEKLPDQLRKKLIRRFSKLSDRDLYTTGMRLVVRKV